MERGCMATAVKDTLDPAPGERSQSKNGLSVWRFLVLLTLLGAFEILAEPGATSSHPFVAARFNLAISDAQAAFQYGHEWTKPSSEAWRFGVLGELETRVFGKDHLVPVSANLRYQYQETRTQLGMGGYLAWPLSQASEFRVGLGLGVNFGRYRGVQARPPTRISPSLDLGYSLNFAAPVVLTLGYQYREWPHSSPHRFGITFTTFILGYR
jgi:hypothetical protein